MFGTSGIRGPVGDVVTADLALAVGRAVASDGAERVVVGHDARDSGTFLSDAVVAGLAECGTDVLRLGLASTPTIARAVEWRDADAGVVVTASHNPAPDNGIKLWNPSGQAFDEAQREAITERIETEDYEFAAWDELGTVEHWAGAVDRHVDALFDSVDVAEPLSVVVDVGNGPGALVADALDRLGCTVQTLNAQPDGGFPGRPSEPTAENCTSLQELVRASDADLGIAHDGDADRMRAVAGTGEFVTGDVTLALFARAAASPGERVAAPVDTSLLVDDALEAQDVTVTRTRVGDVYVAECATEPDVGFGGEPSGAWIWPEETLCPDGPLAACKLVELVSKRGPLADLVAEIETYPIERTAVETPEKEAVMAAVREVVTARYDDVQTIDGVRVGLGDAWFLVRASGTEPKVRVTAEARSEERTADVFAEARALVEDAR